MSFSDTVAQVRTCPGVELTAIAARDGIAVQIWGPGSLETEELIAEYANFLREVFAANRELQLGDLEQIVLVTEHKVTIVTTINDEYFLIAVARADGLVGKARIHSRIAAYRLRVEFS
jgi:predicted regulator of Ras-like GTPase activity (Roadblock/LC7/MglB family)